MSISHNSIGCPTSMLFIGAFVGKIGVFQRLQISHSAIHNCTSDAIPGQ